MAAVADDDPGVAGQDAAGIDGGRGPVPGVHVRQPPGAGQVDIAQAAGGAGRGLVRVDRLRLPQQPRHQVREAARIDQGGGLRPHPGDPPGGGPQPGQLRHQLRRPAHGDIVPARQEGRLSVRFRPVAGPRPHARRQFSLADRAAARAHLRLRHVLGDLRRRRGLNVGDLVAALREDLLPGQVRAAPPALRRRVPEPVRRVVHQAHRRARLARLLPDDVEESFPARRSTASTRAASRPFSATASPTRAAISRTWAVSCAITRYASASRSASTPCGKTASSSADGRPGSSGTARNHATTTARQPHETANRSYPVTSNNTLTLAE